MIKKAYIKINKQLKDFKIGDIVQIEVDKDNVPIDRYWYRRLKDSKIDKCIEFTKYTKNKKGNQ